MKWEIYFVRDDPGGVTYAHIDVHVLYLYITNRTTLHS